MEATDSFGGQMLTIIFPFQASRPWCRQQQDARRNLFGVCFVDRCWAENGDSNRRCDRRYAERGNSRVYHRDRAYYSAGYTQHLCVYRVCWCTRCSVSDSFFKKVIYHQYLCNSHGTAGDWKINFIIEKVAEMCSSRDWTRRCYFFFLQREQQSVLWSLQQLQRHW